MPKLVSPGRFGTAVFAASATLIILAAPTQPALAQKPSTPVTVVNPEVPVTVANPATNPVLTESVDEPGRSPFQMSAYSDSGTLIFDYVVPTGKRLVILYASVGFVPDNQVSNPKVALLRTITKEGTFGNTFQYLPVPTTAAGQSSNLYSSGPVIFYVEPGSSPAIEAFGSAISPSLAGNLTGYLVSIP